MHNSQFLVQSEDKNKNKEAGQDTEATAKSRSKRRADYPLRMARREAQDEITQVELKSLMLHSN